MPPQENSNSQKLGTIALPFKRSALSLRDLADVLFRQKRFVVPSFLFLIAGIAVVVYAKPRVYESEMLLLVKNDRVDVIVTAEHTTGLGGRGEVNETQIATEIQLLSSKQLFREVVKKCSLANLDPSASPRMQAILADKAERKLEADLKISPVLRANMIRVSYSAPNPALAALVLQVMADEFLNRHLKMHRATGAYEFFDRQARIYEDQLRAAQGRLALFQRTTNVVLLDEQKDLSVRKLVDLESGLRETAVAQRETEGRIEMLKAKLAGMSARITTQSRSIPNQYSVERLNTMLTEMQNKRTELLSKFLPEDRIVQQLDRQIGDTRGALEHASKMASTEETTDVNPLRQTLTAELAQAELSANALQARSRTVATNAAAYRRELAKLSNALAGDSELNRSIKDAEGNLLLYSKKREEARITDALDKQKIANIVVAEPSRIPLLPKPRVSGGAVTALLLGCSVILSFAFVSGIRGNTVFTPCELEGIAYIPVLATVPRQRLAAPAVAQQISITRIAQRNNEMRTLTAMRLANASNERAEHIGVQTSAVQSIPVHRPEGERQHANGFYLPLVCTLMQSRKNAAVCGKIAFTSVSPGEGVTSVVQGLAREMALHTGERVLIAPSGSLNRLVSNDPKELERRLVAVAPLVWTIPGPEPIGSAANFRMQGAGFPALDGRFGYVLIDCPSLRRSSEALYLSAHSDGVVLVVAAGETRKDHIEQAQRLIKVSSSVLLGFVLNKRTYPVPEFLYKRL